MLASETWHSDCQAFKEPDLLQNSDLCTRLQMSIRGLLLQIFGTIDPAGLCNLSDYDEDRTRCGGHGREAWGKAS